MSQYIITSHVQSHVQGIVSCHVCTDTSTPTPPTNARYEEDGSTLRLQEDGTIRVSEA